MKKLKEEIVDKEKLLKIVNERKEEGRTIEDIKKDYPDKIAKKEETLLVFLGKNDPKRFKTEFLDSKWKYLT